MSIEVALPSWTAISKKVFLFENAQAILLVVAPIIFAILHLVGYAPAGLIFRMNLLVRSLALAAAGFALFLLFAPQEVREHKDVDAFVLGRQSTLESKRELEKLKDGLTSNKVWLRGDESMTDLLALYFEMRDNSLSAARAIVFAIAVAVILIWVFLDLDLAIKLIRLAVN